MQYSAEAVATNKTPLQERRRSSWTIHYVPDVVVWIVNEVLLWQKQYGAPPALVKECDAPEARTKKNTKQQHFFPEICPLFRHQAAGCYYPPSHSQITHFWGKFCGLYDRKNKERSETSGTTLRRPILSHVYTQNGFSWDFPNFGLHCLRVAGVSALLDAGVPLGVVASMTGHLTPVMTLYYYRADANHVRQVLSEAKVKLKDFPKLSNLMKALDSLESVDHFLIGTPQAMEKLAESRKTRIYQLSLSGICPGAACDDGLPKEYLESHGHAVPGAKCPLCRFRVYGPPFVVGLAYEWNCLMFEVQQSAKRQVKIRAAARKAEMEKREVDEATAHSEESMLEQENQLHIKLLARLTQMINESIQLLNRVGSADQSGMALITADNRRLQAITETAGEFDQLKKILEESEYFQTSRLTVPDQALRLMQEKFMQMCRTNGAETLLAGLPTDIAKKSTLLFAQLLEQAIPKQEIREGVFQGHLGFDKLPGLSDLIHAGIKKIDTVVRTEEARRLSPSLETKVLAE